VDHGRDWICSLEEAARGLLYDEETIDRARPDTLIWGEDDFVLGATGVKPALPLAFDANVNTELRARMRELAEEGADWTLPSVLGNISAFMDLFDQEAEGLDLDSIVGGKNAAERRAARDALMGDIRTACQDGLRKFSRLLVDKPKQVEFQPVFVYELREVLRHVAGR
jgi:hypothetical protein